MLEKTFLQESLSSRITVYRGDIPSGSSVPHVNAEFVELAHQDLGDGTAAHEFGHMLGPVKHLFVTWATGQLALHVTVMQ
jgi:hypothetical protein